MKYILAIFFVFEICFCSFSQKTETNNNVYNHTISNQSFSKNSIGIDIAYYNIGYFDGVCSSINYERSVKKNINLRVGFGYFASPFNEVFSGLHFPVSINFLSGNKNNHFEFDIGARVSYFENALNCYCFPNQYMLSPIINLGYRYQKQSGGIIYKALIGFDGLTLGAGYAF